MSRASSRRVGSGPLVVCIAMDEAGHMASFVPLVAGLVRGGARCVAYAPARFRARLEAVGARFVDVFAGRPLASVDDESSPIPCRYVSFAGHHGADLAREIAPSTPDLVVYDSFAVVGRVVARLLDLPHVPIFAGHDLRPELHLPNLRNDSRLHLTEGCRSAVEALRGRFGLPDASPFSYVGARSPHLNVCAEPPEFVEPAARAAFEPAAWYGCLPDACPTREPGPRDETERRGPTRLYASFGTVVARYFRAQAIEALAAIAAHAEGRPDLELTVGLGGMDLSVEEHGRIARRGVRLEPFVDQWATLGTTDVFLTHQGLHSTHEAVFHEVPMISYPFFWDQPALAARCRALGLSVPLCDAPRAPVSSDDVGRALEEVLARGEERRASLARARAWELRTLAGRAEVVARVLRLADGA